MKRLWVSVLGLTLVLAVFAWMGAAAQEVRDPVCGMKLDASRAKFSSEYKGQKYYFCSADCQAKFEANPALYMSQPALTSGDKEETIYCSLPQDLLSELKVEKKETATGLIISMTSTNPEAVKKLQNTIGECQKEMKPGEMSGHTHGEHMSQMGKHEHGREKAEACCLMCDQNYEKKITKLNNGVRLELKRKN